MEQPSLEEEGSSSRCRRPSCSLQGSRLPQALATVGEREVVRNLAEKSLALEQEKEDEESWSLPLQLPPAKVEEVQQVLHLQLPHSSRTSSCRCSPSQTPSPPRSRLPPRPSHFDVTLISVIHFVKPFRTLSGQVQTPSHFVTLQAKTTVLAVAILSLSISLQRQMLENISIPHLLQSALSDFCTTLGLIFNRRI